MSIFLTIYVTFAHFIKTNINYPNYISNISPFYKKKLMSIILTIYVTLFHFIKTNVNHPNYICSHYSILLKLMSFILTMYVTLAHFNNTMSIILTIYVTLAHFIKTNVNHPNYICNISPFYKN